ncbi:hypothetical protein [Solirubrobacter soli]|uniref:hypothetical protein n=1 Tax=Solirubrobacter soli TaxID=363832 RepID=UPI0004134284|nr:hypothetical protein [Solirubrobacter soli]
MRLAPKRLIAVPFILLAFAVTACGSATVAYKQAPGEPVDLSVPGNGDALAPAATPTATASATETPDAGTAQVTPTPAANSGAATTQTTPQDNTGGGTEAPAGQDSATNDQPPPAGSDAQQFEDFCAENPGAC